MRKWLIRGAAAVALVGPCAQAADMPVKAPPSAPAWAWQFDPAISVGYASGGDYTLTFNSVTGAALLGANRIDFKVPTAAGLYVAGELPVRLTDRLALTLGGRWIFFHTGQTTFEQYNGTPTVGRNWEVGSRGWGTVDLLMSYAILKDAGALRALSPVVGFRWDRTNLGFDNPTHPLSVYTDPTDTVEFRMDTYAPVFGLTATFAGFHAGNFGGAIKLGVYGSPWIWGDMNYREMFNNTGRHFEFGANNVRGSFITVTDETTLLSGWIAPGRKATLALTAQYTRFNTHDTAIGTSYSGGNVVLGQSNFDFNASPDVFTIGLKGGVAF